MWDFFTAIGGAIIGTVAALVASISPGPALVLQAVTVNTNPPPAITLSMNPTSGLAAGGMSVATIGVVNSSATAQQCTLVGKDLQGKVVDTTDPTFTVPAGNQAAMKVIYGTSSQQWPVPADWSNASNTIEVIGGGGGASGNAASGRGESKVGSLNGTTNGASGGGGGGAYSKISNVSLTPGSSVNFVVGAGGPASKAGGDTYFNASSMAACKAAGPTVCVGAKGGSGATDTSGASGGQASAGVGTVTHSGGNGGNTPGNIPGGGGGGGAAGPHGNGNGGNGGSENGSNNEGGGGGGNGGGAGGAGPTVCGAWPFQGSCGGAGGNAYGISGSGGSGGNCNSGGKGKSGGGGGGGDECNSGENGGVGGNGIDIDGVLGGGGGGGGGGGTNHISSGGNGGLYGGGGGGKSHAGGNAGVGAQGIVVIRYVSIDASSTHKSSHVINKTTDFTVSCIPSGFSSPITKSPTVRVTLKNDCTLGGVTVDDGTPHVFYNTSVVPYSQSCSGNDSSGNPYSQSRTCSNGTLSGSASYSYGSCIAAPAPPQTEITLSADNSLVRKGSAVNLTWDGGNSTACLVSGTNGFSSALITGTNVSSGAINQTSAFTLTCTLGSSSKTASITVNLIPTIKEI